MSLTPGQLTDLKKQLSKFKEDPNYRRIRSSPTAKLFGRIALFIDGYDDASDKLDLLYQRLDEKSTPKRLAVVNQILGYLSEVHKFSIQREDTSFISIPLYDIRTLEKLMNILVVEGVYPCLPDGVGISLAKRRLKSFKMPLSIARVDPEESSSILRAIVDEMAIIFSDRSDLRDLIQVGTGFTDALTCAIYLAESDPGCWDTVKALEQTSSSYQLMSLYTIMLGSSTGQFKSDVLKLLSQLMVSQDKNGVQSAIDVVMGLRDNDKIDTTRIPHVVSALLHSKPQGMDNAAYFANIMGQLYDLLVLVNRPVMNTIAAAVVQIIFTKNPRIVTDFLFQKVWDSFNPPPSATDAIVLTSESQLNNAFNVALSFSRQYISSAFSTALFKPIMSPLWAYAVYQKKHAKDFQIVLDTLVSIMSIDEDLLHDLMAGLFSLRGDHWEFSEGSNKLTIIKESLLESNASMDILDDIDISIELFTTVLGSLSEDQFNYALLTSLKRWLKLDGLQGDDPYTTLANLKIVQALIEKFQDRISSSPEVLLKLIVSLLNAERPSSTLEVVEGDSDDEDENEVLDEATDSALEILAHVVSNMSGSLTTESAKYLEQLDSLLSADKFDSYSDLRLQVKRLLGGPVVDDSTQKEQNRLMEKAMKCIVDPVPSVRAYGMQLIRQLADPSVGKVSTKYAMELHLAQLTDKDPFVYLNAVKGLEEVAELDLVSTVPTLLSKYSEGKIDEQLRIGEVLLRLIERSTLDASSIDLLFNELFRIVSKHETSRDIRLRMSAMSLVGALCHRLGDRSQPYLADVVDLVEGILTFEKSAEESVMRRAVIVAINDLVTAENGLQLVGPYGEKLDSALKYIADNDVDLLVREQAKGVLYVIDAEFESAFSKVDVTD